MTDELSYHLRNLDADVTQHFRLIRSELASMRDDLHTLSALVMHLSVQLSNAEGAASNPAGTAAHDRQ